MRYVCASNYYFSCRRCDPSCTYNLLFFNSIKEIFKYALDNIADCELLEIYNCKTGQALFKIDYEVSSHACHGMRIKVKGKKFRTIDNAHGRLIWAKV